MTLALGVVDPLQDLPLGEANPVDWVNIYTTTPTGSWEGPARDDSGQFCILGGQPSVDPLIPGVCNTTTLIGGVVVFTVLYLMSGKR